MGDWYTTRELVKDAAGIHGSALDETVDENIDAASREFEGATHTRFIPLSATRKFDAKWPVLVGNRLYVDADLWSVTSLTDKGDSAATVESTEYRLLPENNGPPYHALQLLGDVSSALFEADPNTYMQSFRVTGEWSRYVATVSASSLAAAIADTTGTSVSIKDGSKIGVGDTILIDSERMFVTDKADADLGVNASGALTASDSDQTVSLGDPADDLNVGEFIRVDSEKMRVTAVNSATSVEVERAVDGTVLAAHSSAADIYVYRTLTVERGVNGSTAATHADDATITKYQAPADVRKAVLARAVVNVTQDRAQWGRQIVRGDTAAEFTGSSMERLWKRAVRRNRRNVLASAHGTAVS